MRHSPTGWVAGDEDDERGGELLLRAGPGEWPDAEGLEHRVGRRLEGGQQRQLVGTHRPDRGRTQRPTVACVPVRAVVCSELGPPSLLRVEERPDPESGPGAVVIDVEAAGVQLRRRRFS